MTSRIVAAVGRKMTYANVMSTLAFTIAFGGGTAYATHLTVFSDDIVDGEVKTVDLGASSVDRVALANDAAYAPEIAPGAFSQLQRVTDYVLGSPVGQHYELKDSVIKGNHVANNTLTGYDVNEGSLGTVPKATRASSVDGIQRFRYAVTSSSTTLSTLLTTTSGLTIKAKCDGGDLEVYATTSHNARLLSWSIDADAGNLDNIVAMEDFTSNHTVDLVNTDDGDQSGQTSYFTEADGATIVTWAADNNTSVGLNRACVFSGVASTW